MSNCVFCDIVAGDAPVKIVREWDDAIALVPLDPVVDGHVIVIPRVHVADATTDPAVTLATMDRALELVTEDAHANILTSIGRHATQSIFHLHVHVVPRVENDQLMLPWGTTGVPHLPHRCKGMDERDVKIDELSGEVMNRARQAHDGAEALRRAEAEMVEFDDVSESYPILRVLKTFAKADIRDELFWSFKDGELKFFALCSDIFEWGTADMEEITPGDLDLLEQTRQDLAATPIADRTHAWAESWTADLYAARKRKKRPQGALYKNMPEEIRPLFDACGPERKVGLFNPTEQP